VSWCCEAGYFVCGSNTCCQNGYTCSNGQCQAPHGEADGLTPFGVPAGGSGEGDGVPGGGGDAGVFQV
jgi:hypothetical protein